MGCSVDSPRKNIELVPCDISVLSPNDASTSDNTVPIELRGIREWLAFSVLRLLCMENK
jgi:hypothetical protein